MNELISACSRYVDLCHLYLTQDDFHAEELHQSVKYFISQCTDATSASILLEHGIIDISLRCVDTYAQSRALSDLRLLDQFTSYIALLLSNFTNCGETYTQYIYMNHLFHLESIISIVNDHVKGTQACISVVCRCISYAGSNQCLHPLRLSNLDNSLLYFCYNSKSTDRSLICQVLLLNLRMGSHPSEKSPILEWIHILTFTILKENLVLEIFHLVGSQLEENRRQPFLNHEQVE